MHDELHTACLVEKSFQNDVVLCRQAAERGMTGREILNKLLGRSRIHRALVDAPTQRCLPGRIAPQQRGHACTQLRH